MGERKRFCMQDVMAALCVLAAAVGIMAFTGLWPTGENPYKSYTLQALAWLNGRLDLGQDYPWLELAVVDGRYFVSFPPFPSVVLLPFAAIFGPDTPDHMISLAFTLLGAAYASRLAREVRCSRALAPALCLYLCNGYMFIAVQGWVWFIAQTMCFTLSLMALTHARRGEGCRAMTCWACAVGCRPMVIVYFPVLVYVLMRGWRRRYPKGRMKAVWLLPAVCIGLVYMALNALRFGNPLEFGHSYLPEFTRSAAGQFSLTYLPENLAQLFRLPQTGGEGGALRFYTYDCQAFWLISPMLVVFLLAWGCAVARHKRAFLRRALPLCAAVHLMIVLCHRTLGGWQFGNRYLLDMMPWLFYGVLAMAPPGRRFEQATAPLYCLGAAVNLMGTVAAYNHWI